MTFNDPPSPITYILQSYSYHHTHKNSQTPINALSNPFPTILSLPALQQIPITTPMRRRSGALHCETEIDFIQLAEAAQDHIGIFYDERANRKIMTHLRPPPSPTPAVHNPQLSAEKKKLYCGFDFGLESEADREEREQLCRANVETTRQLDLALLTHCPTHTLARLTHLPQPTTERQVELVTERQGKCTVRYWVVRKDQEEDDEVTGDGLRGVYLQVCGAVLQERGGEWVVQRGSDQWSGLVQSVRRRLND